MLISIFSNVALLMVYMMLGFALCKFKKAEVSHAKSMSGLLIYVLAPSMIINSFLQLEYTEESVQSILKCFFITLLVQLLFMAVIYAVLHKKYEDSKYRILTVGAVLGNVGFIGMPIISSLFPNEPIVLCYSSINVLTMNLIVFTMGVFLITNNKKYISLKSAILNPTTISIFISLPLFFLNIQLPAAISNTLGLFAKVVTPFCMIILGMRLSHCNLKNLFTRPFVYIASALKLIVFPVLMFLLVRWLPILDDTAKISLVILSMCPSGAVIESLAELHECEQEFAANVVLLSTILCVVTIPVMSFLLIK